MSPLVEESSGSGLVESLLDDLKQKFELEKMARVGGASKAQNIHWGPFIVFRVSVSSIKSLVYRSILP